MSFIYLPPAGGGSPYWADPVATYATLPITDPAYTIREVTTEGAIYYYDGAVWQLVQTGIAPAAISDTNSVDLTITAGVLSADVRLSADAADAGYILGELAIQSGASKGLRSQVADSLIRGLLSGTNLITYTSATGVIDLTAATVRALLSGTNLITYTAATGVIDLTSATIYALFSGTAPIQFAGGVISITQSGVATDGYLSSVDWNTFNNKEGPIAAGTVSQYWRGDKTFQTLEIPAVTAVTSGAAAATGAIGERLTATQVAFTTTNVGASGSYGSAISLSVTAGSWKIDGNAGFKENGAVLTTALECGISASATAAGISVFETTINPYLISSTSNALFSAPSLYVDLAGTTTYYLNTKFYYSSGTPQHNGRITATRIR